MMVMMMMMGETHLSMNPFVVDALPSSDYAMDQEMVVPEEETTAAYEVLEAINNEVPWRSLYAGNLCVEGPHGFVCAPDDSNVYHIVEINLGWVSNADNNPVCGKNASISPSLQKFPFLRKLFFYNCFTGMAMELPPVLWSLSGSLEELVFLRNPKLVGNLPAQVSELRKLQRLVLTENGVGGEIPPEVGELGFLQQLVLSHNRFHGEIPDSLSQLKRLKVLDLSSNQIRGTIPWSLLGEMLSLIKLDLSHNLITGKIPETIGFAQEMRLLDLSSNQLWGEIPDVAMANLNQLRVIQLSHNNLNSQVPRTMWEKMEKLVSVAMAESGLTGRIPAEIGRVKTLRSLDLRGNKLEGGVPMSLSQLPHIYEIDLSSNKLAGEIPFSAAFMIRLGRNLRVGRNEGLCCNPNSASAISSLSPHRHQYHILYRNAEDDDPISPCVVSSSSSSSLHQIEKQNLSDDSSTPP